MQFEGFKRSRYLYGCIAEIRGKFQYPSLIQMHLAGRSVGYFHENYVIRLQSESSPSQCG